MCVYMCVLTEYMYSVPFAFLRVSNVGIHFPFNWKDQNALEIRQKVMRINFCCSNYVAL